MQLWRLKASLGALAALIAIGSLGFVLLEGMTIFDAMYFTVITVATVGYGDIVPHTQLGRLFTMALVIVGVGLVYYSLTMIIAMIIEGDMKDALGRRDMERQIEQMTGHIIVCGAGRVGENAVAQLRQEAEIFVVIENNAEIFARMEAQKIPCILGNATFDEVLLQAGLLRAKGIITALSHDADNVYVTLTAKSLNPGIHIVARAERTEAEEKLRRAGADIVVFPSVMGGRQMVSALTRPVITDLMEKVFYNEELHLDMAQITISQSSPLVGETLAGSHIKEQFDSIVVAVKRGNNLISNPKAGEIFKVDDILIVIGQRSHLGKLQQLSQCSC